LGEIIFSDAEKRNQLNKITHPKIYREMFMRILKLVFRGYKIVVVTCSHEQQLERLMNRNDLTMGDAESRIAAQMPIIEKCQRAQHVITNTHSKDFTRDQVKEIVHELDQLNTHWMIRLLIASPFILIAIISLTIYFIFR